MRFWILIATIIFGVIGGCKKATVIKCVKGKIVRITCPTIVIQVLNDDTVGEDGWIDIKSSCNISYDNVFNIGNRCDQSSNLREGDIIWFTIDSPTAIDCIICNDYDAPPGIWYDVNSISRRPCIFN